MTWRRIAASTIVGSAIVGVGLLGWSAGASFAQTSVPGGRSPMMGGMSGGVAHEQMHAIVDAMHGAGTSERMHQAMGLEAEQMMEQCTSMKLMMQHMSGMMGNGMMGGSGGMMSMHGGQNGQNSMTGR